MQRLGGQLNDHIVRANVGHISGKTTQHHDHHAEIATTAHQQNFNIFNNVCCRIARRCRAGWQHFMPHQRTDNQQNQTANKQYACRGITFNDVARYTHNNHNSNKEFNKCQHRFPCRIAAQKVKKLKKVKSGDRMCLINRLLLLIKINKNTDSSDGLAVFSASWLKKESHNKKL